MLPIEKPLNMIGRPIATSFGKIFHGILYVLRNGCQWKMLVLPREYGSGSICNRRFQQWNDTDIFKKIWSRLLKEYDYKEGIKWM